jgi:hypothetical protein
VRRQCGSCGIEFEAHHSTARYCSGRCRKRASRGHVLAQPPAPRPLVVAPVGEFEQPVEPVEAIPGRLEASTRAELASAGRESIPAGVAALLLAERIDAGQGTESGMASLVREWRTTMAAAMADAQKAESELDKLRKLRAERLGA